MSAAAGVAASTRSSVTSSGLSASAIEIHRDAVALNAVSRRKETPDQTCMPATADRAVRKAARLSADASCSKTERQAGAALRSPERSRLDVTEQTPNAPRRM